MKLDPDSPKDLEGPLDVTSWSQHLDKIQWEVIKVFMAGQAALAAGAFSYPDAPWITVSLFATSVVGVLYVASFRVKRHHLHRMLKQDSDLAKFLRPPGEKLSRQMLLASTWTLFSGTCALMDLAVAFSLFSKQKLTAELFGALCVAVALIVASYWVGRDPFPTPEDKPKGGNGSATNGAGGAAVAKEGLAVESASKPT